MSSGSCTCTDCNRVLWIKDGPTCPECLALRKAQKKVARLKEEEDKDVEAVKLVAKLGIPDLLSLDRADES